MTHETATAHPNLWNAPYIILSVSLKKEPPALYELHGPYTIPYAINTAVTQPLKLII